MRIPKVTKKNIRNYLKTRRDNKYYFKFPWFDKKHQTMVCQVDGVMIYHKDKNIQKYLKDEMLMEAFRAYQGYLKKWEKLN